MIGITKVLVSCQRVR